MCQKGARVVQQEVLDVVDTTELRAYAIWEPILQNDNHKSALQATTLIPDARVTHYWVDGRDVGKLFQHSIELNETAWDVYLVYPPGVVWGDEAP
jgi:hypothetical protein